MKLKIKFLSGKISREHFKHIEILNEEKQSEQQKRKFSIFYLRFLHINFITE